MFGVLYKLYSSLFHLGRQRPPLLLDRKFFAIFSVQTCLASHFIFHFIYLEFQRSTKEDIELVKYNTVIAQKESLQ